MTCDYAAEFVSALCDGEIIPREAAEHIGSCETCATRLRDYTEMGAELRRVASLTLDEEPKALQLKKRSGVASSLWSKGWKAVRVPRLAFAALLAGFAVLGFSLAMVKVHARGDGAVLMLTVTPSQGRTNPCPLSTVDKKKAECGWADRVNSGYLTYEIRLLSKDDDRVKLGVHAQFRTQANHISAGDAEAVPEKDYSFAPGETLKIDVAGLGPITVTGEWRDYMPYFGDLDLEHKLEPAPDELRIIAPVLLKGKTVVIDFGGDSVIADHKDDLAWFYVAHDGLYELSLSQLPGAIQGHAENNRLSFTIDGGSYTLLTGAPIARNEDVWILHTPNVKPSGEWASHAVIGTEMLGHLIPRAKFEN